MNCTWCEEEIEEGQRADIIGADWHIECIIRQVTGSVAHVLQICACYVSGSIEGDPPGMSRRQAAKLAVRAFEDVINRGYRSAGMKPLRQPQND